MGYRDQPLPSENLSDWPGPPRGSPRDIICSITELGLQLCDLTFCAVDSLPESVYVRVARVVLDACWVRKSQRLEMGQ